MPSALFYVSSRKQSFKYSNFFFKKIAWVHQSAKVNSIFKLKCKEYFIE